MRNKVILIGFCTLFVHQLCAQVGKSTNQVGVSGLPIYDIFNFYPKNEISGGAISVNYGTFVSNKLCFGVNLFYAAYSNQYDTQAKDLHKQKQNNDLMGLNTSLRYYCAIKKNFLVYGVISIGFGINKFQTTNLSTSLIVAKTHEPIALLMAGLGINYFITKNFALELNVPYVFVNRFSYDPYAEHLNSILPTIGIQYYWPYKE